MRLRGIYIDGFGIFHNLRIEGLSPELTLFLGMNETGKSTLLNFLRGIFFGFPDGRSSENPYPPLAGGRHGGNLTLVTEDQQLYVVERYPGPHGGKVDVLKPDQTRGGRAFLTRLLGTGDKNLFKSIYAFSLSELQGLEALNAESVREALYSAGAGVDPARLTRLKSELEKREGELYKPGGSKPRINGILSRLNAISKEKKALEGSIEEYDRIRAQISEFISKIQALEKRRRELSARLKRTEQWLHVWPEWKNLSVAKERLEQLEEIDDFPVQGLHRLENLKTRVEDAENERLKKEEDLSRQESEFSSLTVDTHILNHAASIRQLQMRLGHFEGWLDELVSLREELAVAQKRAEENLNRLGPTWTEEKLLEFDLSIGAREEVRHQREALQERLWEVQKKRESLELLVSRKNEALEALRTLPEPPIKDPGRLGQMKKALKDLRKLLWDRQFLEETLRNQEERLDDLKVQGAALERDLKLQASMVPGWAVALALGAGLLFLVLAALDRMNGGFLVAGLVSLLALGAWFLRSHTKRKEKQRREDLQGRIEVLKSRAAHLEERRAELTSQRDQVKAQVEAACSNLALSGSPSGDVLERLDEELTGSLSHLQRWVETQEEIKRIEKRVEQSQEELRVADSALREAQEQWKGWLQNRGLNPVLTPEGALETLSIMESHREQLARLNQLRNKVVSLEQDRENFSSQAKQVLRNCHRESPEDHELLGAVRRLAKDLEETEKAVQKQDLLTREMKASRQAIERIEERISKWRGEIRELLGSGGAGHEEEFRKRAETFQRRMALKEDLERSLDAIKRHSHDLGTLDQVLERLPELSLHDLEEAKVGLEKELKDVGSELERFKTEVATLEERVRLLVHDVRISALRMEEEGLKETLSLLAMDWSAVKLAQGLLRRARERYQKERQPEVIREAGRFFKTLTLGRYPSLVAPLGENRIEVMGRDHRRKEVGQLSRGTAEQLYLSLRFGFIREFSKATEALPIIMDEVLVNFDPDRAKATAGAILELSQAHQILYFTCHPETVQIFREMEPRVLVLEITEQGVRKWEGARKD